MNGSRKRFTAYDTLSYYFIMVGVTLVDALGDLVAPGERRFRCSIRCLCGGQLAVDAQLGVVFSGGPCLLDRGGLPSLRAVKRRRSRWEFRVAS